MGHPPSREIGLTGFLLGVITSSALTFLLSSYLRRHPQFKVDEGDKMKDAAGEVGHKGASNVVESTNETSMPNCNGRDFFDDQIGEQMSNVEELQLLLRRARAINSLAHTLTLAPNEKSCFEEVSRLIIPLFRIDGCAFGLMKDSENVIYKHITCNNSIFLELLKKTGLDKGDGAGLVFPLKDTASALVIKTLKQYYCPRTKDSLIPAQQSAHKLGLNTILVTPILVNGDRFAGCIVAYMVAEDAFSEADRTLINDVATMLGASIYSKRLRVAAESSNRISREMLHSMIPAKVIEKIECFWDDSTIEYQRRNSGADSSFRSSYALDDSGLVFEEVGHNFEIDVDKQNMNGRRQSLSKQRSEQMEHRRQNINAKVRLLNQMNNPNQYNNVGMMVDTTAMELNSSHGALYAETLSNVCIIFTNIVGFSEIALEMRPIKVMDMLQGLFSRFDALCDRHGIQKLETIGDAYIATTDMFDEDKDCRQSAANALSMAKKMVRESRRVLIPKNNQLKPLEIRVGIHIGEITAGVLGERLPKFTVFGTAVNFSARMEQTCLPSMIRVTKDFFELLPDSEDWHKKEVISIKNMGEVETYLIDPMQGLVLNM